MLPCGTYDNNNNYVSVTEWPNGEGYSISVWEDRTVQSMELSFEAFDALIAARSLVNVLDVDENK
jgi:hypothetical protein